jgi:ABC-type polysaccharide/polyol phosphate transport system ATPase subunit
MQPIISVRNLSKRYRIGERRRNSFREILSEKFRAPLRLLNSRNRGGEDNRAHVWALSGVNFEVQPGEVLGLVGSNGAGKSTLLQILSRVTRPTAGKAELYGRVRSLLEVGTGFHPELTGRENVFLNGAILGMRRGETQRKFDEIVTFAEVEKFLDTPVKHYSSGMYVRLAFAVAAFLEPEILLVDEVLAVGDARFWQKSIDKMRELNARGMTIVLVTHNMWLVQTVCTRGLLLQSGRIAADGTPQSVIDAYRRLAESRSSSDQFTAGAEEWNTKGEIRSLQMARCGEWITEREAAPDSGMILSFTVNVPSYPRVRAYVRATSPDGMILFTTYSQVMDVPSSHRLAFKATVPRLMLRRGDYLIWVGVCSDREKEEMLTQDYLPLQVKESSASHPEGGLFWNAADWEVNAIAETSPTFRASESSLVE